MIKVLVSGALGRMGIQICKAVDEASGIELVGGVDVSATPEAQVGAAGAPVFDKLADGIDATQPDVVIDFTRPDAAAENVACILGRGANCVLGTTGLSEEDLNDVFEKNATGDAALFHAPNFTTGAVLMMLMSEMAAKYFPDAEVIELHHDGKKDAPSGTAIRTARMIADARDHVAGDAPGSETELAGFEGARGALVEGVPVHSVRTAGYVAHQEVIFGSLGQTLTIRHDSIDRTSYMPGIIMAVRAIVDMQGVTVGLEKLMMD